MIPTSGRAKLSHTESFPLGAKEVSEALAGVPPFDLLTIDFGRPLHRVGEPYWILCGRCWARGRAMSQGKGPVGPSWFEPSWRLYVYLVPRPLRRRVHELLVAEGLPRLKTWLIAHADTAGRTGHCNFNVWFDELGDELRFKEEASPSWTTLRQ